MNDRHDVKPGARLLAAVLAGVLTTGVIAPYANAQPGQTTQATPTQADRDKARGHYNAGKAKLDAKDYAGALPEFQAANAAIPSPQALEKIARCYDGMNDIPNAIKAYELFIDKAQGVNSLNADVAAAKERITALRAAGATAPVSVAFNSVPAGAQVMVDGQLHSATTPFDLKLSPGKHKVRVTATGYEPHEQEIDVKPMDNGQNLSFSLTEVADQDEASDNNAAQVSVSTSDLKPGSGNKVPAYVVLGVAGASAVVGTVFGIIALKNKSDFNDYKTDEKADRTERHSLIADIAFGTAVTLGITGTVLLLHNSDSGSEKTTPDAATKRSLQVSPFVGRTGGGAAATWTF